MKCPHCSSELLTVEVDFQEYLYCQECHKYFRVEELKKHNTDGGLPDE